MDKKNHNFTFNQIFLIKLEPDSGLTSARCEISLPLSILVKVNAISLQEVTLSR